MKQKNTQGTSLAIKNSVCEDKKHKNKGRHVGRINESEQQVKDNLRHNNRKRFDYRMISGEEQKVKNSKRPLYKRLPVSGNLKVHLDKPLEILRVKPKI